MIKLKTDARMNGLNKAYLFSEVKSRVAEFLKQNGGDVISLGVGDVAYPIPKIASKALITASQELGDNARFRGYPDETGYEFLKSAIIDFYKRKGVFLSADEIFLNCGAKSDTSSFADIFEPCEVVIPSPVYPVYLDTAIMRGDKITLLKGTKENGFLPMPIGLNGGPKLIWICSPNNPTGACYNKAQLKEWVDYAIKTGSLILFDGAYSAFSGKDMPKSIYEIEGAKACAVEFFSFSKYAGFTNLRCSFIVIPSFLEVGGIKINKLWKRRQSTKFNGVNYPVQRAAEAVLSKAGEEECLAIIDKYRAVSRVLRGFLNSKGVWNVGGEHSPYVWLECPKGKDSWAFFDEVLNRARVIGTPGVGFGLAGEGFFRFTCFATEEKANQAVERLEKSRVLE